MIRTTLLFGLLALSLAAKDSEHETAKGRMIRFTTFGVDAPNTEFVISSGGRLSEPFAIPGNGFSKPVPLLAEDGETELGLPLETKPDNTKSNFKPLAKLPLTSSGKRFLSILLPAKGNTFRPIIIDADDSEFRPGHVMIFNLASETLGADLGGKKLTFKAGSRTIFRPQKKGELANYQIAFYRSKDGQTQMFGAGLWPFFDNKRAYVFLYVDPKNGRPTYRSIDEFTEWLTEK